MWLIIRGVPLNVWCSKSFSIIASIWGRILVPEPCSIDDQQLMYGKVCIMTKHMNTINNFIGANVDDSVVQISVTEEDGGGGLTNLIKTWDRESKHLLEKSGESIKHIEYDELSDFSSHRCDSSGECMTGNFKHHGFDRIKNPYALIKEKSQIDGNVSYPIGGQSQAVRKSMSDVLEKGTLDLCGIYPNGLSQDGRLENSIVNSNHSLSPKAQKINYMDCFSCNRLSPLLNQEAFNAGLSTFKTTLNIQNHLE